AIDRQAAWSSERFNMVPLPVIVPVVVVPVEAAIDAGGSEGFSSLAGLVFGWQEETQEGGRIACWVGKLTKLQAAKSCQTILEQSFVGPLGFEDMIKLAQLSHADRSVEFAKTVIRTDVLMVVGTPIGSQMVMAMIGEGLRKVVDLHVVSDDRPTFSASDGFHIVEREAPDFAECTQRLTSKARTGGLGDVFDQKEALCMTQFSQSINPGHGPAHVNCQHGLGLRGDSGRDRTRIETQCLVDIGEDGHSACQQHRFKIGHESKGREDDIIAGPDPASRQGCAEGSRAAGTDMGVSRAETSCQSLFKVARL